MKMISQLYLMAITGVLKVSSDDANCTYQGCTCYISGIDCEGEKWTTLPTLLVNNTMDLPYLNLQNNLLTTIEPGSLPSGLSTIIFRNNPLETIDPTAFDESSDTLRHLFFSEARFTQIPEALTHLNLTSLSIEDTHISQWDVDTLKHIGLTLLSLTLNNVSLTSWPDWIQYYPHLQTLEMTSSFTSVPNNAFDKQADSLFTLQLVNGNLSEISLAISNMYSLTTLVLDNNNISTLPELPRFQSLSSLSIKYNSLWNATHLSDALKPVSNSLRDLQVEGNKLSSFPDLSFMKKLLRVYLSHNLISDTSSGSISSSVSRLEAENNSISSLAGFLTNATNLQYLILTGNVITSLSGDDIHAKLLGTIDVSTNLITELTNTSFPANSSLGLIFLDYNPLSKVSPAAFAGLTKLISLSMKGTQLARLPLALSSLTNLLSLDMSESSNLVCTCLEKSLRPWYLSRPLTCYGLCGELVIDYFLKTFSQGCS